MNTRLATRLALSTWTLIVALILLTLLLAAVNAQSEFSIDSFAAPLILFAASTIGALVASRQPKNLIGWIFCVMALLNVSGLFAQEYTVYTFVTRPGSLPGGLVAAWLGAWVTNLGFGLLISFTLLLFPDGSLPSRRWRPVAWLLALLLLLSAVSIMFKPGPLADRYSFLSNPFGIESAAVIFSWLDHVSFVGAVLASLAAVIVRFRRARGAERQQLKWFTYAVVLLIATFGLDMLIEQPQIPLSELVASLLTDSALALLPVAIGIAILRYRLYDIDILINRTLVYGALTGTLLLVYFGSVVALQGLFRALTGQERNDLVIVVSTLAIAALFNPLRKRIQAVIDRRFYRRKYEAARVLSAFSDTLRDEVDLNRLTGRLVEVVEETMQPAQVSLWLRRPERE